MCLRLDWKRSLAVHVHEGLQPTEPVTKLDQSATSSAGGCSSSRDVNKGVPKDVPRRDGQWGGAGTVRGLGPARESAVISGY